MVPVQSFAQPNVPSSQNSTDELSHIAQEMYKKNLDLNERNKTLALLRKIDEIVLSSVTDLKQIAQQVSDLLTEDEFKLVGLYLLKDAFIVPLSISTRAKSTVINQYGRDKFISQTISKQERENVLAKVVNEKKTFVIKSLSDVFNKSYTREESVAIQNQLRIKSVVVYPLIVRRETIGILVIGISEAEGDLSAYRKDLVDRLAGVVGIALDNSLLYQSIQEANERLKQLDKLKDEFVSLASHELRTPMTIIKSYLWMFLSKNKGKLPEKDSKYLERAYESTERLINLVNDMLNVSRIESGRLKLQLTAFSSVDLIRKVVTELTPRAKQLGLSLTFSSSNTKIPLVYADSERVEQILINLIGNSLKFTPSGGSIIVSVTPQRSFAQIQVSDNGKGMSDEVLQKLFQKFSTMGGNYLRKQEGQGTGLGLYLSKSLVELQGGKIMAESPGENKGSTFSFTVPYANIQGSRQIPQEADGVSLSFGSTASPAGGTVR